MEVLTDVRPHDLLRISPSESLIHGGPGWLEQALQRAPWVVVRRDATRPGFVPVGVRGTSRGERHPGLIRADDVVETLAPAELLTRIGQLPDVPAAAALHCAVDVLNPTGVEWGPGGSTGFSLASGVSVVTADSDLDLVIRLQRLPQAAELGCWYDGLSRLPARVDCQLDLPLGGVALAELLGPSERVLLRTATGPRLVDRSQLR
ncbi:MULTISPECIES: malonate decarboxylase holo-ACP synthase [unclassified Mycobacterium]|uniref:malonate decarboxylase holo-ACP synthase n=1 Tax=unclassified Mycobacterium TaxID=2642494 RepID=UPI0029C89DBB|nr:MULTISPECIES: malonate decarboxylase holo-ACP synthase [unclassified Mycobacterium]